MTTNPSLTRHAGVPLASRIAGRGALLRTLRQLLRRVERFGLHRAATIAERTWAAQMADALEAAWRRGTEDPSARASLAAVDRRRAISAKVQPPEIRA